MASGRKEKGAEHGIRLEDPRLLSVHIGGPACGAGDLQAEDSRSIHFDVSRDPLRGSAPAHLVDVQVSHAVRPEGLCLGLESRHRLAHDFNGIHCECTFRRKGKVDPVQCSDTVAHIDQEVLSSCRPGIHGRCKADLFADDGLVSSVSRDRQQEFGRSGSALRRLVLQAADIETGLAVRLTVEADRHDRAAFFSLRAVKCKLFPCRKFFFPTGNRHRQTDLVEGDRGLGGTQFFEALARILLQQDPLHQGLLSLRNIHRLIVFPAQPLVRSKSDGKGILVFIDLTGIAVQIIRIFPEILIAVGKAFFFDISEGHSLLIISEEIPHPGDLIEEGPVIEIVVLMDHPVELSGLREKLRAVRIGQAPVILCVGDSVQQRSVVFRIVGRIPVKRLR